MKTLREALSDHRSLRQKIQDLHDHPNTEPHLKASAKAWLGIDKQPPEPAPWSHVKDKNFRDAEAKRKSSNASDMEHGYYAYNGKRGTYNGPDPRYKYEGHTENGEVRTVYKSYSKGFAGGWKEHSHKHVHGEVHDYDDTARHI